MKIIFTVIFILLTASIMAQGSQGALDFDGTNNTYVNVGNSDTLKPTSTITVEAWIKPHDAGDWKAYFTNSQDNGGSESGYGLYAYKGNILFWVQTVGGAVNGYDNYPQYTPTLNVWQHVVGVYDGSELILYLNGVEVDTYSKTGNVDYDPAPLGFRIGQYYDDNETVEVSGSIDEIRIWSTARTAAQIRDNMCKKLTGGETGLLAYWQCDEGSGTTLTDLTSHNLHGTLNVVNGNPSWITSAAPIGDESANIYDPVNWSGKTINLTSDKGDLEVNTVSGNPDGVQLYKVNARPNVVDDRMGLNDKYYGTFVVGGSSPSYSLSYDYTGYSDAEALEPNLDLLTRADNTATSWGNLGATVDASTNILSKSSNSSNGEFILAGKDGDDNLPIELIKFSANIDNDIVILDWQTATEINNDYFTIERSIDGIRWNEVIRVEGAGNSNTLINYTQEDKLAINGINYYRLKQTDFDGDYSYSNTIMIKYGHGSNLFIYPNPTSSLITIEGVEHANADVSIFNTMGQDISVNVKMKINNSSEYKLDLSNLANGLYYIRVGEKLFKVFKQ